MTLEPLEIASGLVFGVDPKSGERDRAQAELEALEAVEQAVLPALLRPPCVVSFSGGRDSSIVLAVAARVARREGLDLPIPATNRFPSVESADEDDWQHHVVSRLGLGEWARLEHVDELDCVGPVATDVLRKHGLLWPFNAHFHVPLLRIAAGGSLLTGIGGDELLSEPGWTDLADLLRLRRRPVRRDLRRIAFAAAPPALRRVALESRLPLPYPWLRPHARKAVAAEWAAQNAAEPFGWAAHLDWVRRLRYLRIGTASLRRLAADDDVELIHPFLDRCFVRALASLPREARFTGRTALTRHLFGGIVSDELLARETKASFDAAFWSTWSGAFAEEWDGSGVEPEIVDPEALRSEWLSGAPDPRSFTLAQAVWLGSGHGLEQLRDCVTQ